MEESMSVLHFLHQVFSVVFLQVCYDSGVGISRLGSGPPPILSGVLLGAVLYLVMLMRSAVLEAKPEESNGFVYSMFVLLTLLPLAMVGYMSYEATAAAGYGRPVFFGVLAVNVLIAALLPTVFWLCDKRSEKAAIADKST
jgi:hypothetical protein